MENLERKWKMEFHPKKCQVIRITNKTKPIESNYQLHNQVLENTDKAKYLGVTIDSKLTWKDQQKTMCQKANNTLAFLKRNTDKCPMHVKDKCYKALVKPVLEYGACVWDPHYKNQIERIEKVQKRAARFVTKNYNMTHGNTEKNMNKLKWKNLEEHRAKTKVITFYKALKGDVTLPVDEFQRINVSTRQGSDKFLVPKSNINSHQYSYFPSTLRLWNNLPQEVKELEKLEDFKKRIKDTNLTHLKTP